MISGGQVVANLLQCLCVARQALSLTFLHAITPRLRFVLNLVPRGVLL